MGPVRIWNPFIPVSVASVLSVVNLWIAPLAVKRGCPPSKVT
jgi:hypothetical protein